MEGGGSRKRGIEWSRQEVGRVREGEMEREGEVERGGDNRGEYTELHTKTATHELALWARLWIYWISCVFFFYPVLSLCWKFIEAWLITGNFLDGSFKDRAQFSYRHWIHRLWWNFPSCNNKQMSETEIKTKTIISEVPADSNDETG